MAAKRKQKRSPMSVSHKAALAEGRDQGRTVRRYLEALEAHKPKRGRKRTAEGIERRLQAIEDRLAGADPLSRLQLVQERMTLQSELAIGQDKVDLSQLEIEFVAVAASYGQRKGISYPAWREVGVDPSVLRAARIRRSD